VFYIIDAECNYEVILIYLLQLRIGIGIKLNKEFPKKFSILKNPNWHNIKSENSTEDLDYEVTKLAQN